MSDADLRELERKWHETGNVEDGAALLGARTQAGELDPRRLRLASALGDEASRAALGDPPALLPWTWVEDLEGLARETRVAVALAFARAVVWSAPPGQFDAEAEAALGAIQEWVDCPCHDHAVSAQDRVDLLPLEAIHRQRRSTLSAKAVVIVYHVMIGIHDSPFGVLDGPDPAVFSIDAFADLVEAAQAFCVEEELRSALRKEVVPLLLETARPKSR